MNNNIRKTEEGFEVEYTDREQEVWADIQTSELSIQHDLQEQIQKIRERNVPEVAKEIEREVAENWAQSQLQDIDKEELRKGFTDMLLHNKEVWRFRGEGSQPERIVPGTPDWWRYSDKIEKLRQGEEQLMEKVDPVQAIQHDMEMKPVQDVYTSLEEILDDLETIMSPYNKQESAIVLKLQRTIYAQKYIQDGKE